MKNFTKGAIIGLLTAFILSLIISNIFPYYYSFELMVIAVFMFLYFPVVGGFLGSQLMKAAKPMKAHSIILIGIIIFCISIITFLIIMFSHIVHLYFFGIFICLFLILPSSVLIIIAGFYLKGTEVALKKTGLKQLDTKHVEEIKNLIADFKSLTEIKSKVQRWKGEGYNVDEIEHIIDAM